MSAARIPVMIHLPAETFLVLERTAEWKGMHMRDLMVAGLMRSTQPRPQRTAGQIPSSTPGGGSTHRHYRRLDADEWRELRKLKAAGWTVPELAVKYGCSSSIIYKRLRDERR